MTYLSPNYVKRISVPFTPTEYVLEPSSIDLIEPVVAEGQVVFAADVNGDKDIVMAAYTTVNFTVELA